jgi:hypothetical protein
VLTAEDVIKGRKFDDVIAKSGYPVDIHGVKDTRKGPGSDHYWEWIEGGGQYDIPYRCLVPREIDGLLVSGRCISTTHEALGSTRVMASCMAIGEACGTAAALAVDTGVTPRDINIPALQARLLKQDVILYDNQLEKNLETY